MPATIKDIARECGVSTATVSYVLNNGPRSVLPETRARVLEVARRLQYHPNSAARSLKHKRTNTLGVVLTHPNPSLVTDAYYSGVLDGINGAATRHRQNVMLFTGLEWVGADQSLTAFCDRRVDGLLLLSPMIGSGIVKALSGSGFPFVLVSGPNDDPQVPSVNIDHGAAAFTAVLHLVQLGHRRIGMLAGNPNSYSSSCRLDGYQRALRVSGIEFDPDLMLIGSYDQKWGYLGAGRLLAHPEAPTAIFAANDMIACGVYQWCEEQAVPIPDAVSVMGFDDIPLALHLRPPLTTVRQPLNEIGAEAARLLLKEIQRRDASADGPPCTEHLVLPTALQVRASTAARGRR